MPPSFRVRPALRVPRRAIPERIDAEVLLGVLDAGFEAIEADRRVLHHHRALALVVRDGGDEPVFMQLLLDARVENPTPEPRHRQIQEIREARDPEQAPHVTKHIVVRGHEIFAAAARQLRGVLVVPEVARSHGVVSRHAALLIGEVAGDQHVRVRPHDEALDVLVLVESVAKRRHIVRDSREVSIVRVDVALRLDQMHSRAGDDARGAITARHGAVELGVLVGAAAHALAVAEHDVEPRHVHRAVTEHRNLNNIVIARRAPAPGGRV